MASSHMSELHIWKKMCTWRQMQCPTCWGRKKKARQKVEEKWCKKISCYVERVYTIGLCISSFLSEKILREPRKLGSKHSKSIWHKINKILGNKEPSRGIIQKCAPHERSPCAPNLGERSHEETLHQEGCARRAAWDLAEIIYKLKNSNKSFFSPIEANVMPTPTSTRSEEREFVVDSGASMHMMSKKV